MTPDKDKSNSAVLDVSRKVYETSLALYPKDLRTDFGEEMVEVFEEQISDAYQEHGMCGVLNVWTHAVREFVGIAIVKRMLVPAFAIITAFVLMIWLAGFMVTPVVIDKACGH